MSFIDAAGRLAVRLNSTQMRDAIQLQVVFDLPGLLMIVNQDRWDTCLLKVGQIRQLPINSAVSPTDAKDHGIRGFPFFLS